MIALLISMFLPGLSSGQEFCVTMEHLQQLIAKDPSIEQKMQAFEEDLQKFLIEQGSQLKATNGVVTLPVVFHIIYNTEAENIPDLRIAEQMEALNRDYSARTNHGSMGPFPPSLMANCEIQFCLAKRDPWGNPTKGIERRETTVSVFPADNSVKYLATGGLDAWDPNKYMNIWVCNMEGLLNYAQFPGSGINSTYGVVDDYMCVGFTNAQPLYDLGAVPTHELGHCFDCRHIWGDDQTACTGSDLCLDTPNQAGPIYDPVCGVGGTLTDACSPNAPGIMYMNFMDYSRDMYKINFTPNQKVRMQALFNSKRGPLYQLTMSNGCIPTGTYCDAPINLIESYIGENTATLDWDAVSGAASYNVQYMAKDGSWITNTTTSNHYTLEGLLSGTNYIWRIQTVCSGSIKSTFSTIMSFTTEGFCPYLNTYEPNETMATAAQIGTNTEVKAGIPEIVDHDWYKFSNNGASKKIKVQLYNLPADYDLVLYNSAGIVVGESHNPGTTAEKVIYNTGKVGTYYIHVYGVSGAASSQDCYSLKALLSAVNYTSQTDGTNPDEAETPVLFRVYPNPVHGILEVEYNSVSDGLLDLRIFNMLGSTIAGSKNIIQKGLNHYTLDVSALPKGIFLLELNNGWERKIVKLVVD
jgi:hypothetical protein